MPRRIVFLHRARRESRKAWLVQLRADARLLAEELRFADPEAAAEGERIAAQIERLTAKGKKKELDRKQAEEIVRDWYWFVRALLKRSFAGQAVGRMYPRLLDHMGRKAGYVLRSFAAGTAEGEPRWDSAAADEMVFALRLLRDWAQLFVCWLDPSERGLIGGAMAHGARFEDLITAGREYASLLAYEEGGASVLKRYLTECRESIERFGAFLADVRRIAEESVLLGVFPSGALDAAAGECDAAAATAELLLGGAGGMIGTEEPVSGESAAISLERAEPVVLTPLIGDDGSAEDSAKEESDEAAAEEEPNREEAYAQEAGIEEEPSESAAAAVPMRERIFAKASDHKNIVGRLLEKSEPLDPIKKPRTLGRIRQ